MAPRRIAPEDWQPVGVQQLEHNALVVVRSEDHRSVLAGPGAGKTELLAQRAAFLLQTGASPAPQRILAISFKRDAARNLAQRVAQRCHSDHAARFDSLTFDAFAKGLVDRFGQALPERWRPTPDYEILFPKLDLWRDFLERASRARDRVGTSADIHAISPKTFEGRYVLAKPLPEAGWPATNTARWVCQRFWDELLRSGPRSRLTFPMLGRLAELLLRVNSAARQALALTYSHVFMDEFQDTTQVQYDLVHTIFHGTPAVLTAVGDNKQQIMRWALAMADPFAAFERDFHAERTPLRSNYRSPPELVRIQHVLAQALDAGASEPQSRAPAKISGECCAVWDFSSSQAEARFLASFVSKQMREDALTPRDFVLLVRQKADDYAQVLAPAFAKAGIALRNEATYVGAQMLQELLTEELSDLLVLLLRIASTEHAGSLWGRALQSLSSLRGIASTDDVGRRRLTRSLDDFVRELGVSHSQPPSTKEQATRIVEIVVRFLGRDALTAANPAYAQGDWLTKVEESVGIHLHNSAQEARTWPETLDAYEGTHAVSLMTLHKSKGLEYHTVIFVGLDDSAWWSYQQDTAEATAGFFVAFTRAKQRVVFTYAADRGRRNTIAPLYELLQQADVETRSIA